MRTRLPWIAVLVCALVGFGCGPKKGDDGDDDDDDASIDAVTLDAATDATELDASPDAAADAMGVDARICDDLTCTTPVDDMCAAAEVCNNGTDDNCNGMVDEGCLCTPGAVQQCFRGQPGRRNIGSCVDGQQTCTGSGEFTQWGPCNGGIAPGEEACDSQDNNCNGCVDDDPSCCIVELACPGPGDLPTGAPFTNYVIDGTQFFTGDVASWAWDVTGGPCDQLFATSTTPVVQSFTLSGQTTSMLTLRPTLSGDYTVHVAITALDGFVYECTFIVHIAGPGLRVELCSDKSATTDLDLHVHRPNSTANWFTDDDCYYANCTANGAGRQWGLANSMLSQCSGGPQGAAWAALGYCRNPRLDIDSIRVNGRPENINVDTPTNNQTYRVAVHYFSGTPVVKPLVNVYCGGFLRGTYGAAPDVVAPFVSNDVWRIVDATVAVTAGNVTDCTLVPLHPPNMTTGFWVTSDRTF